MELKGKIAAVTGGSGFIGSHVVELLKKEGCKEVRNIDARTGFNLLDFPKTSEALKGVDVVFHLATLPLELSLVEPYFVAKNLYIMSLNLTELCRQGVFKTLIQISSSEAYGSAELVPMKETHPMSVRTLYAAGKASSDLLLMAYYHTFNIDCAIARPFNNYGPGQRFEKGGVISKVIYKVLKGERPIIYGDGSNIRDFIYVTDTARGIIEVYKHPKTRGKTVNISSAEPYSVLDLTKKICDIIGVKFNPIFSPARTADVQMHISDNTLAKKLLKFSPKVNFDEGLKRTIKWAEKEYKL